MNLRVSSICYTVSRCSLDKRQSKPDSLSYACIFVVLSYLNSDIHWHLNFGHLYRNSIGNGGCFTDCLIILLRCTDI